MFSFVASEPVVSYGFVYGLASKYYKYILNIIKNFIATSILFD